MSKKEQKAREELESMVEAVFGQLVVASDSKEWEEAVLGVNKLAQRGLNEVFSIAKTKPTKDDEELFTRGFSMAYDKILGIGPKGFRTMAREMRGFSFTPEERGAFVQVRNRLVELLDPKHELVPEKVREYMALS